MTTYAELEPTYRGPRGAAWDATELQRSTLADQWQPDWDAGLCVWVINASPRQHPVWDWYAFSAVHLRPVEGGTRDAAKHFPAATHELLVLALSPAHAPPVPGPLQFLNPPNIVAQVACSRDDVIIEVAALAARACTTGILPLEGPTQSMLSTFWQSACRTTIDDLIIGCGHDH